MPLMTKDQAREKLQGMQPGEKIDFAYGNGLVYSRKELYRVDENEFEIYHSISDSYMRFTLEEAAQVLADERSAWDGELVSVEKECEACHASMNQEDEIVDEKTDESLCIDCARKRGLLEE